MLRTLTLIASCAVLQLSAEDATNPAVQGETLPTKSLLQLAAEKHPEISHIEIKGDNPQIIYIPIIHDNPQNYHGEEDTNRAIEESLVRCQKIAEHLHLSYGVRDILLEGIGKSLSDKYNSPKYQGRKLSVGDSKSIVYRVWYDLLNTNKWNLIPAFEKNTYGPLTLLGSEYTTRIQKALKTSHENGWFRSEEQFLANKDQFTRLIAEAASGYNDRRAALLKEDPRLKREFEITAIQRNKVFIDNILAAQGPGILLCGHGHVQDLIDQFEKRGISYMIVVPKGSAWPPAKKDELAIYEEMLKLGCQLTKCHLTLGDGKAVEVRIPINN